MTADKARRRSGVGGLVGLAVALIGLFLAWKFTPLGDYASLERLADARLWLKGLPFAPVVFVLLYALGVVLAMPGLILTIAGGVVFGPVWGIAYNTIAANLGANAAFWIARKTGAQKGARSLLGENSSMLETVDAKISQHGFHGLLTLRFVPVVPFNVLNFGCGLVSIQWRTYALATVIGIFPGTAIYTYSASAVAEGAMEPSKLFQNLLIAGALLVLLSFLPKLFGSRKGARAALFALALGALSAGAKAQAPGIPSHGDFTRVLAEVVGERGVDYPTLARLTEELDGYLAKLAAADPGAVQAADRSTQLAFWINAYNACMLKRVISHYPIKKAGGFQRLKNAAAGRPDNSVWQISDVFGGDHCEVAGALRSQDHIEHEVIRPMGDARIHFAVNCAAKSCPPLIGEAYVPERLQRQLDARVEAFVADPRHFMIESRDGRTTLWVNKVLDWFKEDFGDKDGIRVFFAGYVDDEKRALLENPSTKVEFFEYDWTLNDATLTRSP